MSYYFLSQRYERDDVLFIKVKNDLNTPHFTAVLIALHLVYKVE